MLRTLIRRPLFWLFRVPVPSGPIGGVLRAPSTPRGDLLVVLPTRTPGVATARRHVWSGVRHGLGALRDVDAWADARLDPARGSEADVHRVAALHQLDTAIEEMRTARRALAAIKERRTR